MPETKSKILNDIEARERGLKDLRKSFGEINYKFQKQEERYLKTKNIRGMIIKSIEASEEELMKTKAKAYDLGIKKPTTKEEQC